VPAQLTAASLGLRFLLIRSERNRHFMKALSQWDRIRAVIFDVDGTLYHGPGLRRRMLVELITHCLADPRRLPLLRLLRLYRSERERLAEEEASGILRLQYERPAARLGIPAAAVEEAVGVWIHRQPLPYLRAHRIPGAERFLALVRASGRAVAVLSDYPAKAKLAALGLDADRIVCGTDSDVDRLKPHPAGLIKLVNDLGMEPDDCLLIGDRDDRDGAAARRIGMPCLLRSDRPRLPGQFVDFRSLLESIGSHEARRDSE
jgi:FMN phosphatase YigB (HAD superfamily)